MYPRKLFRIGYEAAGDLRSDPPDLHFRYNPQGSTTYESLSSQASVNLTGGASTSGPLIKDYCAIRATNGSAWPYPNQTSAYLQSPEVMASSDQIQSSPSPYIRPVFSSLRWQILRLVWIGFGPVYQHSQRERCWRGFQPSTR